MDGVTLDEETVARMLELAEDLAFIDAAEEGKVAREADILGVGAFQAPLTPKIASLATFLAGGGHANNHHAAAYNQKLKVFCHDNRF